MNKDTQVTPIEAWDPLEADAVDAGMLIAAQRREIRNILKSYTGYWDLFAELIQNALDAVERRSAEESARDYRPHLWFTVNMSGKLVAVTDNGCGMDRSEFRQFLRPNFSFKRGDLSRGSKGVGATYLAYGFNHLEVATKRDGTLMSGVIKRGREWVEDRSETVQRPKVEPAAPTHHPFHGIDRGASMVVRLVGASIRPSDLTWIGATTADTWLAVLRTVTPLGGVYICGDACPNIDITLEVISTSGETSVARLTAPRYLFPNEAIRKSADLREFLADRVKKTSQGKDVTRIPARFRDLNGLWGEWTGEEILQGNSPITHRLEAHEQELVRELGLRLWMFLAFSTDVWDNYNDKALGLRKGHRLLKGGLQLATRHMPQGLPLTIPMTNNIGFQNLAHVLVHFANAEPDLGRKGFQPEQVRVAEKLSVSAVTAFRRHYNLLRKPGGARDYADELLLDQWKQAQIEHERACPLVITGTGLFAPTEELSIRSEPVVEQDVVALFNQMLSSGLIRGIHLISSSQYKQYDGLFRLSMHKPFERYIVSENNPLGLDEQLFAGHDSLQSVVKVLEYKYSVDGLIEELQGEMKAADEIDLVVAWEMGEKWREMFQATSYLDPAHTHLRTIHGTTHRFTHAMSGLDAFELVVLRDLVAYLRDRNREQRRQQEKYGEE